MVNLLFIGIGGAFGALSRYGIFCLVSRMSVTGYPVATLFINVSGSFLAGLIFQLIQTKLNPDSPVYFFLTMGFLGAFTTFSTFSVDMMALLERKAWLTGFSYCFLSVGLSLLAAFSAMRLVKAIYS